MSQHDFTIANQGFPGFRSDLNNALQALATHSSGSSAPSPTFAYQIWVDTSASPAVLKLRNGDNDAWINLGNIDNSTDTFSFVASAALTGSPTSTTPAASDDSTRIATTAYVRDVIPSGVIVMWSGSIASIPAGWYLCDGNNSTPDLRNKFIIAANADDSGTAKTAVTGSATQTGGNKDLIVPAHTHTGTTDAGGAATGSITAAIGSDFGSYQTGSASGVFSVSGSSLSNRMQGAAGTGSRPTVDMSIPTHTHSFTTGTSGSSPANANLPPYFALAYIMKA